MKFIFRHLYAKIGIDFNITFTIQFHYFDQQKDGHPCALSIKQPKQKLQPNQVMKFGNIPAPVALTGWIIICTGIYVRDGFSGIVVNL